MTTGRYNFVPAPEDDKKFVARLVKEARFARGLTPREAAIAVGVASQTWYRWESGRFGSNSTRMICWLLRDQTEHQDPLYWRERALLAERRLDAIAGHIVEHRKARLTVETGSDDGAFSPSSVSLPKGTRARSA